MRALAGAALLSVLALSGSTAVAGEEIVTRVVIEARGRSHGEVRLVRRGDTAVAQTLLVTRTLARAAGRIRDKERSLWPDESPGYGASRLYVQALEAAVEQVLAAERVDRHYRLLIGIELSENAGAVVLARPRTRDGSDGIELLGSDPLDRIEVPCWWARSEIEGIAADRGLDVGKLAPLPGCQGAPRSGPPATTGSSE